MIIHGWKFERKKEKWIVQKDQVKKKKKLKKKLVLNKSKKKKNEMKKERKEVEVQVELYCVKLVELVLFEKKNCVPLVVWIYFVLYLFFNCNHLPL